MSWELQSGKKEDKPWIKTNHMVTSTHLRKLEINWFSHRTVKQSQVKSKMPTRFSVQCLLNQSNQSRELVFWLFHSKWCRWLKKVDSSLVLEKIKWSTTMESHTTWRKIAMGSIMVVTRILKTKVLSLESNLKIKANVRSN